MTNSLSAGCWCQEVVFSFVIFREDRTGYLKNCHICPITILLLSNALHYWCFLLCFHWARVIITTATRGLFHLNINICWFGHWDKNDFFWSHISHIAFLFFSSSLLSPPRFISVSFSLFIILFLSFSLSIFRPSNACHPLLFFNTSINYCVVAAIFWHKLSSKMGMWGALPPCTILYWSFSLIKVKWARTEK